MLEDPVVAYAEHPYVQGTFRGHDAELVPCYDLDDPSELRSAVDRTPFHTEHVKQALNDRLRDEVRLLKAFLKHTECYGAEEATRGASGYLTELFILAHDTFENTLEWATQGFPHPITFDHDPTNAFDDPLTVLDPVDPTRNAAAALAPPVLRRLREAAGAFRRNPAPRFFQPSKPPTLTPTQATERTQARKTHPLALRVPIPDPPLEDPLYAQLRRALTLTAEKLEREQIPVHAAAIHLTLDTDPVLGWLLLETEKAALKRPLLHQGPPARASEHADRFKQRWRQDPAAASEVFTHDGRLFVHVEREADTLHAIVAPHVARANAGKAVDDALDADAAEWFEAKAALDALPGEARGRLLDRRRPWERGLASDPDA